MTTSYEIANKYSMYHSEVISLIMNLAKEFDGQVMKFERKGDSHFELNPVAAAFMLLLLENKNG